MVKTANLWIPERQDIIWIDCNPQVGQEMRDIHPFLVLSPKIFNEKTAIGSIKSFSCNSDMATNSQLAIVLHYLAIADPPYYFDS